MTKNLGRYPTSIDGFYRGRGRGRGRGRVGIEVKVGVGVGVGKGVRVGSSALSDTRGSISALLPLISILEKSAGMSVKPPSIII